MKLKQPRNLREDHDLAQAQITRYIHATQRIYVRYENGDRNIPQETILL